MGKDEKKVTATEILDVLRNQSESEMYWADLFAYPFQEELARGNMNHNYLGVTAEVIPQRQELSVEVTDEDGNIFGMLSMVVEEEIVGASISFTMKNFKEVVPFSDKNLLKEMKGFFSKGSWDVDLSVIQGDTEVPIKKRDLTKVGKETAVDMMKKLRRFFVK